MQNVVGWFEIYVSDMDRALKFYEGVFQKKLTPLWNEKEHGLDMRMFPGEPGQYGAMGSLCKMDGIQAGENSTVVYFSCDDCAIEESRVSEFGGSVVKPKFAIGEYGFISIVKDSESNTIGLHSRP